MKHKSEFIIPFYGEQSRSALLKKCLYIPAHCHEHEPVAFSWEDPFVFEKPQPLIVEYCSGNGQWIGEMARHCPQFNWIAVERDFERARKIWLKIFRMQLDNLFVVYGEGLVFSRHYLPSASVKEVYVNFPDPWPKRRHAKHRIIQKNFIDEMNRILSPNGIVTLVTDDVSYSEEMISLFSSWKSLFDPALYVTEWPEYGDSFFQSLWIKQQRIIRYHRFIQG
jgi:tRNA (guanine-N7-)-methyltransferase